MINWIHSPKNPDVAKYVECYWFLEKKQNDNGHNQPKLNPDPAGHLIIASSEQGYQYDLETMSAKGNGSHWLFPHCHTYQMDHSKPFMILGVKFHIGALYSLDITPKQPVLDQVIDVDINALLNSEIFSETDILVKARLHPEICCDTLDELLLPWLLNSRQDKHSKLTHSALSLLSDTPISNMGELLHCSQRTLERCFVRVTGFTCKQCQSMNRLEAMLEYLYQRKEKDIDWAHVAYKFGFSDQPHLIRYLKSSIGSTPGEYAKQRDLTIDIYGGVESS
ncbi:helix-turn-helix domain-containing protein [Photobacterium sagamiensis]|uniref:helix-turn-helix domain-containing protein n=1 Tax=Photobacterium sagamiensis TaxID=2910241 RepID=UPI003D0DFE31